MNLLGPTKWEDNIYYFTIDFSEAGPDAYPFPGGHMEHEREAQLKFYIPQNPPAGAWNPSNDWSYQGLSGQRAPTNNIPIYDGEILIWGTPPPSTKMASKSAIIMVLSLF